MHGRGQPALTLAIVCPLLAQDVERSLEWGDSFLPSDQITSTEMDRRVAGRVACCAWWTTVAGKHYGIIGTSDGTFGQTPPLTTENLLEITDGVGATHQCSLAGSLLLPFMLTVF